MFVNFLILFVVSSVLSLVFRFFLYDILCLPFNGVYAYFSAKGDQVKQIVASNIGAFLVLMVFTYLFSGIVASFLSWAIIKHPDSDFFRISSIAISLGVPYSLRNASLKGVKLDPSSAIIPSIYASFWIPYPVFVISILFWSFQN